MKTILTAKLKLQTTHEQFQALRATQLAYRDALNFVSRYAFAHGKMSSGRALQHATYDTIRPQYHLPAQMACNIPRQVGATYKGLWTKVKHNAEARKAGRTKKRYKGLDQAPRYVAPTLMYNYQRDYSKANHYARLRKRLQRKGTRSATRQLIAISKRERRLKQDANHCVSTQIARRYPHTLIGLEDLTDIRERTPRRKKGKQATRKQRTTNARHSKWAFAELQSMLAYKALVHESMTVKVDAHYTSQSCPMCGHTSKANRPRSGLLFVCQVCHYTLHADVVGARNVTLRTLLIRQDWMSTGVLSVCPDVSDDEAKAARLQRYAELRWSPDTSPWL